MLKSTEHAKRSWTVEGKYYHDPETNSNVLFEVFSTEKEAMEFAAEKSRRCRSEHAVVMVNLTTDLGVKNRTGTDALTLAKYKKGVEQFEEAALNLILQDCNRFAGCVFKRWKLNTFIVTVFSLVLLAGWVMGTAWSFLTVRESGAPTVLALGAALLFNVVFFISYNFILKRFSIANEGLELEQRKWARQIAYRVATTDEALLQRIFATRRKDPVTIPSCLSGEGFLNED